MVSTSSELLHELTLPAESVPVVYKIGDLGLMSDAMSSKIFMEGDCRYCEQ